MVFKRVAITLIGIIFPPLAVYLLCGPGRDVTINSILFLLAVIPSHIHALYISIVYFRRKSKVRKGRYPGDPAELIYSRKVQNGSASNHEVEDLRAASQGRKGWFDRRSQPTMS